MQQPITFQKKERNSNAVNPLVQALPQNLNTAGWMKNLIVQPKLLQQLLKKHDSPLNIHYPKYFKENCKVFEELLNNYHVKNQILFTRRANKNKVYLRAAEQAGLGVDATSYQELKECLESGVDPEKIVVTGSNKSEKLFRLAINYNVLVIVDNEEECELLHKLAEERGKWAKVGFRVSGFTFEGKKYNSTPGFHIDEIDEFIINHLGYTGCCEMLKYEGLFFHLGGSAKETGNALHLCLDLSERLSKYGIKTKSIGIKGEMQFPYLQTTQLSSWSFDEVLRKKIKGDSKTANPVKNGVGFGIFDGKLLDKQKAQSCHGSQSKSDFLKKVLECNRGKVGTAAKRLLEKSIQLNVELGHSLLDQCGFTICRVAFRKKDGAKNILVGVEMNRPSPLQASEVIEIIPFLISLNHTKQFAPVDVLLTSAYGIEQELLLPHKIRMHQNPEVGDLLIFLNTATATKYFLKPSVNDLCDLSGNLVYAENQHQFTFVSFEEEKAIE